jgi:hypothetical protein
MSGQAAYARLLDASTATLPSERRTDNSVTPSSCTQQVADQGLAAASVCLQESLQAVRAEHLSAWTVSFGQAIAIEE